MIYASAHTDAHKHSTSHGHRHFDTTHRIRHCRCWSMWWFHPVRCAHCNVFLHGHLWDVFLRLVLPQQFLPTILKVWIGRRGRADNPPARVSVVASDSDIGGQDYDAPTSVVLSNGTTMPRPLRVGPIRTLPRCRQRVQPALPTCTALWKSV